MIAMKKFLRISSGIAALLGGLLPGALMAQSPEYLSDPLYVALDRSQSALAAISVQDALETKLSGESLEWSHPSQAAEGRVVPLRTFRIQSGAFCREYREVVRFKRGGELERKRIACRVDPGRWVPLDS